MVITHPGIGFRGFGGFEDLGGFRGFGGLEDLGGLLLRVRGGSGAKRAYTGLRGLRLRVGVGG